jgi:hypothetical protein
MPEENMKDQSLNSAIDLRQDRRQWLKTSATMIGASLLPAPTIIAETPQSQATPATKAPEGQAAAKPTGHFFTPEQRVLVEELTETVIPADDHSGGAKAAGVAEVIDKFLQETYDESDRATWREGLRLIESMSQHYNGKSFVKASPDERVAMLTVLSEHSPMDDLPEVKFFNSLKEYTVLAYYTSKVGIHDDLQYKGNRVIQDYVGCDDQGAAKT